VAVVVGGVAGEEAAGAVEDDVAERASAGLVDGFAGFA
jgi:hypothetical protein